MKTAMSTKLKGKLAKTSKIFYGFLITFKIKDFDETNRC